MLSPFAGAGPGFEEEAGPGFLDVFRQSSHGPITGRSAQHNGRSSLDETLLQAVAGAPRGGFASGPAGVGGLLRSATVSNPLNVSEILAQSDLLSSVAGSASGLQLTSAGSGGSQVAWVKPSGRRQTGEGCEDVEQAVVLALPTPTGGAMLRITLLAAGFCIGPSGVSIRDVCKASGTDIKSWTAPPDEQCSRSCRVFRVEGSRHGVAKAVGIMCDAVDRYKELCEGKYAGQSVARIQHVSGIDFHYQPPPRQIVPFAASLKGQASARRQSSGKHGAGGGGGKPPTAPGAHRQKGAGPGRTASLGASSPPFVPAPTLGTARSASVPHPIVPPSGGTASSDDSSRPGSAEGQQAAPTRHHKSAAAGGAHLREGALHSAAHGSVAAAPAGPSTGSKAWATEAVPDPATSDAVRTSGDGESGSVSSREASPAGSPAPVWPHQGLSAAARLVRSASDAGPAVQQAKHAEQAGGFALVPKLGKGDVLRSVFGSQESLPVEEARPQPGPDRRPAAAAPSSYDVGLLLQQLALQEAQEQASAALALAMQQGVRGGYELSESGVLLPASLSPLARPTHQELPPMSVFEGQLAARGLANSADVLAAVAAAWQSAQAQQAAAADQLLQLAGFLGGMPAAAPPGGHAGMGTGSGMGSPPPGMLPQSAPMAVPAQASAPPSSQASALPSSAGLGCGPVGREGEGQHLPLSAFHSSFFTPFGSVGSPPGAELVRAGSAPASPAIPPSTATGSPGVRAAPSGQRHSPATPQRLPSQQAAMATPPGAGSTPGASEASRGSPPLHSAFGATAGRGGLAATAFAGGSLGAAGRGSPFGSFLSLHHAEGDAFADPARAGGAAPPLSLFGQGSSLPPLPPGAGASMSRAASVPGPQGSCTPMDRLDDLLALARANSYAAPGDPIGMACDASMATAAAAFPGPETMAGAAGAVAHSAFSSAFSPARRLAGGAPPRVALPPVAGQAGGRGNGEGQAGASNGVHGAVDLLLETMF